MKYALHRSAFTLVELLVVITIIGILVAILLPAVQAAREAARRLQCSNNVKQLALGCLTHEQTHGFLPTGGWAYGWVGDPDRGFSKKQPGGWHFNILPYIEQLSLYNAGRNDNVNGRRTTAATPVTAFICPSRHRVIAFPCNNGFYNTGDGVVSPIGRSDYAACSGNGNDNTHWQGPSTLAEGDALTESTWLTQAGGENDMTGVVFRRSQVRLRDIKDGTSNTFLLGERYIDPDHYLDGDSQFNDQCWSLGYDYDVNRWTAAYSSGVWEVHLPMQDKPGYNVGTCFGSAHGNSFNMAFCDGSVQNIAYSIAVQPFLRLGHKSDGYVVDSKAF